MSFSLYLLVFCLSIALQFSACIISLSAMRYVHTSRWVWGTLALAMLLMGVRQIITLLDAWSVSSFSGDLWLSALLELSIAFILCVALGIRLPGLVAFNRGLKTANNEREALVESEEKYRALIESTGAAFVIVDTKGNVTECNETYLKLTGRSGLCDVIGHNTAEWVEGPCGKDFVHDVMPHYADKEIKIYDNLNIRQLDNTVIPVEAHSRATDTPEGIRIMTLVRDISERKAAHVALEDSEEKYRSLIESTGTGYVILDGKGDVIDCNEAYLKMLGRDDIVGHNLSEWVSPRETERFVKREIASHSEKEVRVYESEIVHYPDNVAVPVEVYSKAKYTNEGVSVMALVRDVSDRKAARSALKESEEKYRELIESTGVGYVILDVEGRVIECNPAYSNLIGRGRPDEVVGHNLSEWWLEVEHGFDIPVEMQAHSDFELKLFNLIFRKPDGSPVPVEIYSRGRQTADGLRIVGLVRDVSEREEVRKKLEASEQQASLLFQHSPISTAIFTPDGQLLRANKAHDELWGFVLHEVAPEFNILEDEQTNERIGKDRLAAIFKGQQIELEPFVYRSSELGFANARDNTVLPLFFPLFDGKGKVVSIVQMHIDLTERVAAEQKLSEREALYRALVESTDAGYVVMSVDKRVLDANAEYVRLTGHSDLSEIKGQFTRQWVRGGMGLAAFSQVLEHGGKVDNVRLDYVQPDGTLIPTEISAARVESRGDFKIVALVRDISERLESEGRLRQAQKMDAIGKLTGGVAHDFNNLLAVILGNSELAMAHKLDPSSIDRYLKAILDAAERGADLTHRLLAFSRQTPLAPKVVDINAALENACALLQRLIGEDVDLFLLKNPDIPNCEVDPRELENVIINLANNARDAMPNGGKLTIEANRMVCDHDNKWVDIGELAEGEYVVVSVTDSGTGIAPEILHRVTDPFFTTKDVDKGTGLGLSMAYGFAKQSNGHLSIYSELGEGTTINIVLPSHADEAHEITKNKVGIAPRGNEKILVVEDDPALMKLVRNMLEILGYQVEAAGTVEKGVELYRQHEDFDMLLTDMILPGGRNGRELADELLAIKPTLKVMYMSGYTENAVLHHGRLDEGVVLLQKPFRTVELSTMVRQVLDS
ncbi:MAG: hypothetical protein COA75_05275 [Cellvibrionales bacterium]|nr:MAG: hypothetical protein COA75_05275 [Cellvibrionales bacterium]